MDSIHMRKCYTAVNLECKSAIMGSLWVCQYKHLFHCYSKNTNFSSKRRYFLFTSSYKDLPFNYLHWYLHSVRPWTSYLHQCQYVFFFPSNTYYQNVTVDQHQQFLCRLCTGTKDGLSCLWNWHVSRNFNWRLCLVNYANRFPLILTFLWVRSTSLQFVTVKDIWGSDCRLCSLLFSIYHPLSSLCPCFPLISRPLNIFLYFISSALFSSSSPQSSSSSSSPTLFMFLPLLHILPPPCFSYHSASHPRGDSEQWIYSNAGW